MQNLCLCLDRDLPSMKWYMIFLIHYINIWYLWQLTIYTSCKTTWCMKHKRNLQSADELGLSFVSALWWPTHSDLNHIENYVNEKLFIRCSVLTEKSLYISCLLFKTSPKNGLNCPPKTSIYVKLNFSWGSLLYNFLI